jgi:hypothetical protein
MLISRSLFHVECTKAFPSTIHLLKAIRLVFRGYTIFFFSFLRRRGYFACATVVIIGFSRALILNLKFSHLISQ